MDPTTKDLVPKESTFGAKKVVKQDAYELLKTAVKAINDSKSVEGFKRRLTPSNWRHLNLAGISSLPKQFSL